MKQTTISRRVIVIFVVGLLVLLLMATAVQAGPGASYDLSWYSIDGGGTMFSTGGSYSLGGTIGQPDAGVLRDGGYTLNGGFWGGAALNYNIYLPLVLKG